MTNLGVVAIAPGTTTFSKSVNIPHLYVLARAYRDAYFLPLTEFSDEGRKLVAAPDSGPVWARFYEIGTDRPVFGDRDKSLHDDVNELSRERRNGYGWYRNTPKQVLVEYEAWARTHP